MSKRSQDKETYSVDEMMDRLRQGERESQSQDKGELVTREDGTQALKVRKRKRRTDQSRVKVAKRRKKLVAVKSILLISIPLILGLACVILVVRFHSPSFVAGLRGHVYQETGATAKFSRLSPRGIQLRADSVRLFWPEGNQLDQLKLQKVEGDLNLFAFVTGEIKGQRLTASSGSLLLSERGNRRVSAPKGEPLPQGGYRDYVCDDFALSFGRERSLFRVEKAQATLKPRDGKSSLLSLTDGKLFLPGWGSMRLNRSTLEIGSELVKISSIRVEDGKREIVLKGQVDLLDSSHQLAVEVLDGPLSSFNKEDLSKLFETDLADVVGDFTFQSWDARSCEMVLNCEPEKIVMGRLPFLSEMDSIFANVRYRNLEVTGKTRFDLIRDVKGLRLENIDFYELGVFGLKGKIAVLENGKLSGKLRVGVPGHLDFSLAKQAKASFFSRGQKEGEFYWFDVDLKGSVIEPEDNFSSYLDIAAPVPSLDEEDLFEQLTREE